MTVALLATLLAAIPGTTAAQSDDTAPRPGKVTPAEIRANWQLLTYRDANDEIIAVPPGISVTFFPFVDGNSSGVGACSTYEANYRKSAVDIGIDPPEIKAVACDPATQAIDDAFYQALVLAAGNSIDGDILTLYRIDEEPLLTFTRAEIPLDPTIARWEVARMGDADGSIETVTVGAPTMEFIGDPTGGHVVGSTGCGSFLGSYQTSDSSMRIPTPSYRLTGCTEGLKRQAEEFVSSLTEITDFEVLPAGLTLKDATGTTRLALSPAIELGDQTWTPTQILAGGQAAVPASLLNTSVVQFFGGKTEGITKCGSPFSGTNVSAGLALSTSRLRTEGKGCRKPKKDQVPDQVVEDAFLEALRQTASHALRGEELALLDRSGETLMRLEPTSDLIGPTWVLIRIDTKPQAKGGQDLKVKEQTPTPITARFKEIGSVSGFTGAIDKNGAANEYFADFSSRGAARIEIEVQEQSGRACRGKNARTPMCVRERDLLRLLGAANAYIARKGDLQLLQDGVWTLWFQIQEAGPTDE